MSFFEKLRKNIEEESSSKTEDKAEEKPKEKFKKPEKQKNADLKINKKSAKASSFASAEASTSAKAMEDKTTDKTADKEKLLKLPQKPKSNGELSIDFYETNDYFIVQSTISGIKANDLEIFIENDVLTIKGSRQEQREDENEKYFYRECYWGGFSRQIILPEKVDETKIQAKMKDGVLTLKMPKLRKKSNLKRITINEEE